jgi:hypothetical protein
MAITKTNFINYSRCPRYVALSLIKKERLNADISYENYKEEEIEEKVRELIGSMYEVDENGNEEDLIDVKNPQLEIMMPYYKEIEHLAGVKIEHLFGGKSIYAESTFSQESFDFDEGFIKYLCYVDIYNESNKSINIIEVKATTSSKYIEDLSTGHRSTKDKKYDKYPIFYKDDNGIYHLKEEIGVNEEEMPLDNYNKNRNKLMNRFEKTGKYVYDLSVQRMIIENCLKSRSEGINNIHYYLAVLNHEYVFDGKIDNNKPVYSDDIISLFDFTNITKEMLDVVEVDKERIERYLVEMDAGECPLGKHCEYKCPTECKYSKICFKKIPKYNSSLSYMNNGQGFKDENGNTHKGLDLINEGYINMLDIPDNWIRNPNHNIQRNCLITHKPYINKEKINLALKALKYPIYHLDFETFPCPLPRYRGEKCYTQSPFQFSLHVENSPSECDKEKDHYEYLSDDFNNDTREELVKKLCEYINTDNGTVFAQNVSFEKGRIKELSEVFPQYKTKLLKMVDMASDLLYIVKNNQKFYEELGFDEESKLVNYYHENLSGSYSIKKTLPVFSDLSYHDLDVNNGTEALVTYATFPRLSSKEFDVKYHSLLEYCKQDTWAMVAILDKLRQIVK